jgi:hypothetical protein
MVNLYESLINVVNPHKPKRLSGLHQKVRGQSRGFLPSPGADAGTTGGQARPTSFMGMYAERGNPVLLPIG